MDTPASTPQPEQRKPFLLERVIDASARNAFLVIILTVFGIAIGTLMTCGLRFACASDI